MEVFEDVVLVAVAMGGESTHQKPVIKTKSANSSGPQAELQAYRDWWTVAWRLSKGFGGPTGTR
jgi:hypothetical protein